MTEFAALIASFFDYRHGRTPIFIAILASNVALNVAACLTAMRGGVR